MNRIVDDRIIPNQLMPEEYWLQLQNNKVYPWCASTLFLKTPNGNMCFFANTQDGIRKAVKACWNDHTLYGGWRQANMQRGNKS